jgi:hypothetical protein
MCLILGFFYFAAAPSPTSVGSQFRGVIDGTFEHGLFVTAVLGSQAVRYDFLHCFCPYQCEF